MGGFRILAVYTRKPAEGNRSRASRRLDSAGGKVYDRARMTKSTTIRIELVWSCDAGWVRAHISTIPAYGDGETEEEALADLQNSLAGYVEAFGLADTLARIHR